MTRFSLAKSLGYCAALLCVAILCTPACLAQAAKGSVTEELAALLSKHDDSLSQKDIVALMKLYSPGTKTVILGTGPGERYQGTDQIKMAYTEIMKDFDKGTLSHACAWKDGASTATMAWLAAECKMSDSKGGKKREYAMNVSAVAQKTGGTWHFVMLHYSNLTGGQ